MAGLIRGNKSKIDREAETDDDGAPLMATSSAFEVPSVPSGRRLAKNKAGVMEGRATAGQVTSRKGTINLKSVAQACMDEGLDPAAEIARVLRTKVPARNRAGEIMMGDDGKPVMVDLIDPDTKIRTLTELLQYNQPKLKAVEMTVKTDLSEDEIDQRLTALLAKAVK
jgi:hypothetical protein